ncbi:hypothetical protein J4217_02685 [Candidatus Pacearchaeota archaeon]|nr:hypothetical protein [Candidatus Pacearchaeota archaeon]
MDDQQGYDPYQDTIFRLKDFEEKQNLLKDRLLLIGNALVDERDKNFSRVQEIKKEVMALKEDMSKIKDFLQKMSEQLSNLARKEELMILQRQFDLFRTK